MKYQIELLTFQEWKELYKEEDPRISQRRMWEFETWKKKTETCQAVGELSFASSRDFIKPEDMLVFAEKIISFIKEKNPTDMKMGQYEHEFSVTSICADESLDRVEEYLEAKYKSYKRDYFQRLEYVFEDELSKEACENFGLSVDQII